MIAIESVPRTSGLGDLWLLMQHRVLCRDSTSADAVARVLNARPPDDGV